MATVPSVFRRSTDCAKRTVPVDLLSEKDGPANDTADSAGVLATTGEANIENS